MRLNAACSMLTNTHSLTMFNGLNSFILLLFTIIWDCNSMVELIDCLECEVIVHLKKSFVMGLSVWFMRSGVRLKHLTMDRCKDPLQNWKRGGTDFIVEKHLGMFVVSRISPLDVSIKTSLPLLSMMLEFAKPRARILLGSKIGFRLII